jgi:hypothetical protein
MQLIACRLVSMVPPLLQHSLTGSQAPAEHIGLAKGVASLCLCLVRYLSGTLQGQPANLGQEQHSAVEVTAEQAQLLFKTRLGVDSVLTYLQQAVFSYSCPGADTSSSSSRRTDVGEQACFSLLADDTCLMCLNWTLVENALQLMQTKTSSGQGSAHAAYSSAQTAAAGGSSTNGHGATAAAGPGHSTVLRYPTPLPRAYMAVL